MATPQVKTQVRLSSVGCVRLVDRRGYLTVVLPRFVPPSYLPKWQNIPFPLCSDLKSQGGTGQSATTSARGCARVAHSNPGIFKGTLASKLRLVQVGCKEAKGRLMQSAEQFWAGRETDQVGIKAVLTSSSFPQMEEWLLARARVGEKYQYTGQPREEPRPSSAASVDRRRQRRRAASECKSKTLSSLFSSSSQPPPQTLRPGRAFPGWGGEVQAQTEREGQGTRSRASSRSSSRWSCRGTWGARTAGCPA